MICPICQTNADPTTINGPVANYTVSKYLIYQKCINCDYIFLNTAKCKEVIWREFLFIVVLEDYIMTCPFGLDVFIDGKKGDIAVFKGFENGAIEYIKIFHGISEKDLMDKFKDIMAFL